LPSTALFELGGIKIYAVRGAFTIDRYRRVEGVDWFPDEELSQKDLFIMVKDIVERKPKIIVSHDCPSAVCNKLLKKRLGDIAKYAPKNHVPSRTQQAMQSAFDLLTVKPDYWIFGHHHVWFNDIVEGTQFICVPELNKFELFIPTDN
jgi:hypothetical protein